MSSRERDVRALRDLRALARALLDLAVPPRCAACRAALESGAALCRSCDRRFERVPVGVCPLCQESAASPEGEFCARCAAAPSPLAACIAAVRYAGEAERWIHRFKYPRHGLRGLDPAPRCVVGALLREAARRVPGKRPELLVPIPQHPRRLRTRGFNPAAVLALGLGRELDIRVDPVALRRTRDTPSQTGLNRRERHLNVRDAIRVRGRRPLPERIWLVDDVVTTGSTMAEAARALKRAEVAEVAGVCAARALSEVFTPNR